MNLIRVRRSGSIRQIRHGWLLGLVVVFVSVATLVAANQSSLKPTSQQHTQHGDDLITKPELSPMTGGRGIGAETRQLATVGGSPLLKQRKARSNTAATGRLFFFKGLKKFMWPMFIGLQVVKTVLLALFLPSIIGSLGKIVGKGLSSVSSFNQPPVEIPEDLDFKDNSYNSDMMDSFDQQPQTSSYEQYTYPQDNGQQLTGNSMFDSMKNEQKNSISRYGPGGQKITYLRNADPFSGQSNDFKQFHEMPASSTLLTNYDPFYSPLLSRLDAVFQQLGLANGEEVCREKLICLMYSNPAKYAPYSNLVSAQLSRELNELKKPTTDNPEILRFFKYMRAARDGQEKATCDAMFEKCPNLTDNTNPAMIKTYNDINKLVQARRF